MILYKYMPYRKAFFENNYIRMSSRWSLNDPFEFMPSISYVSDLYVKTKYDRFGKTRTDIESHFNNMDSKSEWKFIEGPYGNFGVISLTSKNNNILMWSHYSDNHSGIVVGFDIGDNFFNTKFTDPNDQFAGRVWKVKYSKKRSEKFNNFHDPIIMKSKDWRYENEYRFAANLFQCDIKLIEEKNANKKDISGLIIKDFAGTMKEIVTCEYPGSLARNPDVLFMFKIPKESIKYIGIGCRMENKNQQELMEIIASDVHYSKIQVEKFSIDNYEFKINPRPLIDMQYVG